MRRAMQICCRAAQAKLQLICNANLRQLTRTAAEAMHGTATDDAPAARPGPAATARPRRGDLCTPAVGRALEVDPRSAPLRTGPASRGFRGIPQFYDYDMIAPHSG